MSRRPISRKRSRIQRGFTLIEIMLVVVIIGILASFAIPYYQKMAARADRTEMQVVLNSTRVYFVNQFENQGFFGPAPAANFSSGVNPPSTTISVGQEAPWDPTVPGWQDLTFPPEGKINLRYSYTVTTDSVTGKVAGAIILKACGLFPGLGPATLNCGNGTLGNYTHTEEWDGPTQNPTNTLDFPLTF